MKKTLINYVISLLLLSLSPSLYNGINAQQLKIYDFALFAGNGGPGTSAAPSPGYGVQIGSSITINGGSVGSYKLVQSTGNASINANIYSGGTVSITNSNIVNGNIAARNSDSLTGPIISFGSSAQITGNMDGNGNIVVGGGFVNGTVTHPTGTTYSGPVPTGGNIIGTPNLPTLPTLPAITSFPAAGATNVSSTQTLSPGAYGDITLGGNKTITLNGIGIYVFKSVHFSGNSNKFIFDFKNTTSGNFYIYIIGDADFGKLDASMVNGNNAARIYTEIHGNGSTTSIPNYSFVIANGSSGGGSKWMGTVWAPYAGINIGSGTGSSTLTGALWSATQVMIQSGVTFIYSPFTFCTPPDANAGIDKPLDFSTQTTLTGTSATPGVSYSWSSFNGGIITSPPNVASITVSVAGSYVLTVSSAANCFTQDTVVITSRLRSVIGSELQSIYDNRPTSSPFFVLSNDSVMIDVIVNAGYYTYVLNLLQTAPYGLTNIISNGASNFIITGKYPVANLPKLNLLFVEINYCRPYYQAYNNVGLINSAGDTSMRSYLVRRGYRVDGDSIKVGIISDSYATITAGSTATLPLQPVTDPPNPIPQTFTTNTAAQDVSNGDLPGDTTFAVGGHVTNPNGYTKNVHVIRDFPIQLSDEGRAMAQIVSDVAPGAEIYFRTGFFTANDFAVGIKELQSAGCKIIGDDVTFITEPFLKDGIVARTVDTVVSQGVAYFSAAGNFANKSYEKDFNPVVIPSGVFAGKMAHNFGGGDIFQHVRLAPGNYTFVFQWTDNIYSSGEAGTQNDMDIYLTPRTDGTSLFGFNRDNTNGDPIEFIPFTNTGTDSVDLNVFIVNNTLTSNPARIKYVVFRGGIKVMEFNEGVSTIVGQANADSAIAVGAARFDKAPPYMNPPLLESFSSIGGTQTNGVIRNKPDIVGPDGVNTTVRLGQDYPNTALDGYSNFFGTSAATPHAAAVAALIMQGRKKFLGLSTSPYELKSLMQSTAIDMGTPGFDLSSGAGFINVDMSMRTFAAPTPTIDSLVIPTVTPIIIPGDTVFRVTVKGINFSNNSIIYFKDSALASTIVLSTNEATAIIPKFDGNPGIRIYTPPYPNTILVNGQHLDGGFSNTRYFFQGDVTVTAVNVVKKYGQQNPALTSIIRINGVLLQDTTLTLADLGLTGLTLTTPATTYSNVGTYIITPVRVFDVNNPTDVAFLQKFGYSFTSGTFTVQKMPLKVTPRDTTIIAGQYAGNVSFNYDFDHTNVPNPDSILTLIRTDHQGFLPNNTLAVIKDFSKTQADGSVLTTANLLNLNTMATFKAVRNSRKFTLDNNNELVPVTTQTTFNMKYLVDVASESIFDYKNDPTRGKFYSVYAGINPKAMLGAAALTSNIGKVMVNGNLVQMVNGNLVQMVNTTNGPMAPIANGNLVQMVNGVLSPVSNGNLVQLVNGNLVQLVNGEFVPVANGNLVQLVNGTLIEQLANGSLVQMVNGVPTSIITNVTDITAIPNGSLVQLVNGNLVQMVNGNLVQLVNGSLVQLVNGSLVQLVNGNLVQLVNGNTLGIDSTTANHNNTAVILDSTDVDASQANWLGAMFGINMITGLDVGTQYMVPGVLVNSNFDITYGLGKVTIAPDPCIITHSIDKSFGSSSNPGTATSLWLNVVTKISGQLKAKGDYLVFKSGSITFSNIVSSPMVTDFPIPTGKIVADNISVPFTKYDAATNTWITKVPIGFSSTSDIFISGVIINSSNGFVKNNNAYTVASGKFYSNKSNFKDQWAYASAAYQPQFTYASIADSGQVQTINGTFRAGTPVTQITHLVNGGSGGGGNNYSGSTNSYDKFTACLSANTVAYNPEIYTLAEVQNDLLKEEFRVVPNPASDYVTISFIPKNTGSSKLALFSIDGKKISEIANGVCQAGMKYQKKIDVSKLITGVYIIQLWSAEKVSVKKIIISR
jgi:Subtilase family.